MSPFYLSSQNHNERSKNDPHVAGSRHLQRPQPPESTLLQVWCDNVIAAIRSNSYEVQIENHPSCCTIRVLDTQLDRESSFGFHLGEESPVMTTLILTYCTDAQRDRLLPGYNLPSN